MASLHFINAIGSSGGEAGLFASSVVSCFTLERLKKKNYFQIVLVNN